EVDLAAFLAGNDILLISENIPKAHELIIENYHNGTITEERLAHSVKKILMAKYKVGLHKYQPIKTQYLYEDLNTVNDDALYETLMENAVTVVKNQENTVPIKTLENKKFAYVYFGDDSGVPFFNQLNKYTKVDWISAETLDSLVTQLESYDTVIIGFHKSNENPWKSYKFSQKELTWIYEIARTNKVILTLFARPYALLDLKTSNNFESIVVGYQNSRISQEVTAQIIFGAREAKGKLPVSAGADFPVNTQIITNILGRLSYGVPETVGLNSQKLKKVDSLANQVIVQKMAPGLQISISKEGKVVYQKSFGYHTYEKTVKVENGHIYDLASLTKILASTPVLMKMNDENLLTLNTKLGDLLPEYKATDKGNISIKEMFSHYAKFKAWIPFYKRTLDSLTKKPDSRYYNSEYSEKYPVQVSKNLWTTIEVEDTIYEEIKESKLNKDLKYLYSDLPFYLIKKIAEKTYQKEYEQLTVETFFEPLGANFTGYNPLKKFSLDVIPPTEIDRVFRMETVHGYVHDQGAAMMGGVSGHAGLFANANDVNKIMQVFLQRGFYGGKRYFKPETVDTFNSCYYCQKGVRRGIGFDKPQLGSSGPTCGCTSKSSFGHSGFTGTFTWADPENEIVYVFLSNRTFPDAENRLLISSDIRSVIQQAIYDAVDW
ncbi:MAG TPA: serine hydrolase, partial [Flavobacteriaceae bacterium]|nr:serine hydrolase [Flavobacteriaceae bacterium]